MEQDQQQRVRLIRLELDHVLERERLLIEELRRVQDCLEQPTIGHRVPDDTLSANTPAQNRTTGRNSDRVGIGTVRLVD